MTNLITKIKEFFSYCYLRYLLMTELYMVDTRDKVVIETLHVLIFGLYWYFNYSIVLHGISRLRGSTAISD